jgi:hypothetical protein
MTAVEITEPDVYLMNEATYHGDPVPDGSLSQSGVKTLLRPGGPARYRYAGSSTPTPAMELGTAAHRLVLGTGPELHEVKADNWRGNAAKDAADTARALGKIPLLSRDLGTVQDMAAELRKHKLASALLREGRGEAELSGFWTEGGTWRRCRWDWLPDWRALALDYKTCADASPGGFAKAIGNFGYHIQAEWYSDGYKALLGERPEFAFIAQEKEPPYLVGVYQVDAEARRIARDAIDRALRLYRQCTETGQWPGYPDEITTLALPAWSKSREDFYAS